MNPKLGALEATLISFGLGGIDVSTQLVLCGPGGVRMSEPNGQASHIPLNTLAEVSASPAALGSRAREAALSMIDAPWANRWSCAHVLAVPTVACVASSCESPETASIAIGKGLEVAFRVADWLRGQPGSSRWDPALIASGIGAVVACASSCGLNAEAATTALGLVACQAATIDMSQAPRVRRILTARVSSNVIEAVFASRQGIDGPPDPLSGRRGLFPTLQLGERDTSAIVAGLAVDWRHHRMLGSGWKCPWADRKCVI